MGICYGYSWWVFVVGILGGYSWWVFAWMDKLLYNKSPIGKKIDSAIFTGYPRVPTTKFPPVTRNLRYNSVT